MTTYRQLLGQHEEVMAHLERLDALLSRHDGGDGPSPPSPPALSRYPTERHLPDGPRHAPLVHELTALRRALVEHFAAEEDGGYLTELLAERPDLRPRARTVGGEHAEILRSVDALLADADDPEVGPRPLVHGAADLVALVRRHEDDERRLAMDAALQDVGVAD